MEASEFPPITFTGDTVRRQQRAKAVADTVIEFLSARIAANQAAPGTLLPSETSLALHWKISRPTVHLGLESAETAGLIARARGNGWKTAWRELPAGSPVWQKIANADGVGHFWRQNQVDGSWLSVCLDSSQMWRWRHIGPQEGVVHAEGTRTDEMAARQAASEYLTPATEVATVDQGGS